MPLEPNQELREKWIAAVKRDGWQPTLYTRLCSDHFAKGHRDSNPLSPDFVPSIFHHTPSHKRHQRHQAMETFEKRQMRKKKRRGAVFLQTVSTAQLNTAEECNTSNTLAGDFQSCVVTGVVQETYLKTFLPTTTTHYYRILCVVRREEGRGGEEDTRQRRTKEH
ncbi:hypothetical protein Pcinc_006435 [Petrolisthes cinctipes]|uniref:THAP-type domain-containing protein n=1 Tax=Petrolisthes cinctipes TaxID=88211 RepID=A0AAE1GBK5_PETCI|nr:hypothetical protein Pcinc_006435 [Petrolisthes cinctipes]